MPEARKVSSTFSTALSLFSKCHHGYNSGPVSDEEIKGIGKPDNTRVVYRYTSYLVDKDITALMRFYRENFPSATVLPKMHILEDHVVPWLERWHIGSGLMGEQGAESIHAHLQKLETQYSGVVSDLHRLKYVVREHNIQSAPQLNSLIPAPKTSAP